MPDHVMRVVVTGDNHLAQRLSRLPVGKALARRQRLRDAFAATVTAAIERQADLFVQAGDLFDVPDPINQDREFVAEQAQRLAHANIPFCAVSGNHDMPRQSLEQGGAAPLGVYATLGAIHYFPDTRAIRPFMLDCQGFRVAVAGLSNDPGRRPGEDPLADVTIADPENIIGSADAGLLIVHAAIGGQDDTFLSEAECVIQPESLARLRGFQVVVTGHIHRFQQRMVAGIATVVCGPSEWMDFGDVGAGSPGYAWLEIGADGLRSATHVNLPAQPRRTITLETADIFPVGADITGATERVIDRLAPLCGADVMVRLWLRGYVTREQYRALDLPQLYAWGQANCFAFEINERGLTWQTHVVTADQGAVRGERLAPRDVLASVALEQISAAVGAEHDLWDATRQALLQRYDALQGEE